MRGLGGKLVLAVASVALLLGALEVGFRVLGLRGDHAPRTRAWEHALLPPEQRLPGVAVQFRPGARFRLDYDSDPRGTFDERGGLEYRINAQGFRGPDFGRLKAPGVFRVAVLGDSFTFGEGVRFEDTLPERLERRLADAGRDDVEVLNLGVSGWATRHEIAFLEQAGLAFDPDLVLVVYVLNDAQYRSGLNLWDDFRAAYAPPGALRHSALAGWAFARVGRHVLGQRYVEQVMAETLREEGQSAHSVSLLAKGARLSRDAGSRFAVVIFPFLYRLDESYPFAALHAKIGEWVRRAGVPVLDLLPVFLGQPYDELWVHPSDQHPNERAHALAAEALAEFLSREGLLAPATGAGRSP